MNSNWNKYTIRDITEINSESLKKGHNLTIIEYLDTSSVTENNFTNTEILDIQKAPSRAKRIVRDKDIIISTVRPNLKHYGFIKNPKDNLIVSTGFAVIKCKFEIVEPKYLYYFLSLTSTTKYLTTIADGSTSTYPSIKASVISDMSIILPPLPTQKKIAHILSTLDDKIELNRKMNQTLEEMAHSLFKSWFVDFDPVHVKATCKSDAELEKAATEHGISKEILDLFPNEFEESEMGMIPKGWEVSTIANEFNVTMGQSPSGKSYNETQNGMLFFQGRRDFGTYFPSERVYTTEPKRLAKENDILLSVRAPVGDINIAMNECCIGRGLAALKHKSNSVSYSYLVVKNLRIYFDGFNTEGTVFGSVNQNTLKSLNVLKDEGIIKKFIEITEPMFAEIRNNSIEILSLQKIRDTLLPKLLSGELDVSNLELELE